MFGKGNRTSSVTHQIKERYFKDSSENLGSKNSLPPPVVKFREDLTKTPPRKSFQKEEPRSNSSNKRDLQCSKSRSPTRKSGNSDQKDQLSGDGKYHVQIPVAPSSNYLLM